VARGLQYTTQAIDLAHGMKLFQESPDIKSNSMRRAREFTGWGYVHIGPTVGALLTAFWALAMDYDVHILLHATASPTTTELRCTQSRPRPRLVRRSLGTVLPELCADTYFLRAQLQGDRTTTTDSSRHFQSSVRQVG
jgi:hypothetical protein